MCICVCPWACRGHWILMQDPLQEEAFLTAGPSLPNFGPLEEDALLAAGPSPVPRGYAY